MKTGKRKHKRLSNPIAVAMLLRYGKTTSTMRDRRRERGGSKNLQREFAAEAW